MSSTRALCKVCLSHIAHEVMHVRGALWAVSKDKEQLLCHHPAGEHYIGQNAVHANQQQSFWFLAAQQQTETTQSSQHESLSQLYSFVDQTVICRNSIKDMHVLTHATHNKTHFTYLDIAQP